jgi:hypothetical protein
MDQSLILKDFIKTLNSHFATQFPLRYSIPTSLLNSHFATHFPLRYSFLVTGYTGSSATTYRVNDRERPTR